MSNSGPYGINDKANKADLGTAAAADVTTSATDTTAGRVLRVGDFGLGAQSVPTSAFNDANEWFRTSFTSPVNALNTPIAEGSLITVGRAGGQRTSQLILGFGITTRCLVRNYNHGRPESARWSDWQELHHTGNLGTSDTAWTTVTSLQNGWTGTVRYIKRGGMVTVVVVDLVSANATSNDIFLLPSGYRPPFIIRCASSTSQGGAGSPLIVTSGQIGLSQRDSNLIHFTITYPVLS